MTLQIRSFEEKDVSVLLNMMRELARFEKYIEEFKVTEHFLKKELAKVPASTFEIYVAEKDSELLGYAAFYPIDFTYTLSPTYVLKELYVRTEYRGQQIGQNLFHKFKEIAQQRKAARLQWSVMPSNENAKQFYKGLGGQNDMRWENWNINIK